MSHACRRSVTFVPSFAGSVNAGAVASLAVGAAFGCSPINRPPQPASPSAIRRGDGRGGLHRRGECIDTRPRVPGPLAATVELEVAHQVVLRLHRAAHRRQHDAEVVVRVREVGRIHAHALELADRGLGLAEVLEDVRQVVAGLGLRRIVLERALVQPARLGELAGAIHEVAEVRQRRRHVRLEVERLAEQVLGGLRVAAVHRRARLDEVLVRGRAAVRLGRVVDDRDRRRPRSPDPRWPSRRRLERRPPPCAAPQRLVSTTCSPKLGTLNAITTWPPIGWNAMSSASATIVSPSQHTRSLLAGSDASSPGARASARRRSCARAGASGRRRAGPSPP